MKKIVRILLILGVFLIVVFAFGVLFFRSSNKSFIEMLQDDPTLWILVNALFFGSFSLTFNVLKFIVKSHKKKFYKVIRIGDITFAVYLFVMTLFGIYHMIRIEVYGINSGTVSKSFIISLVFYTFFILIAIALFFDNRSFHTSLTNSSPKDSINDIGTTD